MNPPKHIIASVIVGVGFGFFAKSLYAGFLSFLSGLLLDIDHLIEYIINHGLKGVTFRKIYQACKETGTGEGGMKFEKLYLIFHAHEIMIILWLFTFITKNIYFLAISAGYSVHLAMDCLENKLHPLSYFMFRRFQKGFETEKLLRGKFKKG